MSNVLTERQQHDIRALGRLGWSLRRIERRTGVRRETISAYLKAAGVRVRARGGRPRAWPPPNPATTPGVSTDSPANPATTEKVSTDPAGTPPTRAPSASACEIYREVITDALTHGRNAMAIWQDLVDDHGFSAKYASVRRFVLKLRGATPPEARVVITTGLGEEGQVDYGEGPMVRDPVTGKYRRVRLFVLTLGYSRKAVRLLTWRSSTQIWAELHERAFRRLGGTVKMIILDNLGEGVLTPDIYDPALNPLYRDVLAHYGVTALPCRVGDPDRKGKVEAGVGHAQKTPLKGLRFETIEAAQAYLDRWEEHWADTRIHGTTKRQVAAMFAEERPALGPLPLEPFRYYRFGGRTVHLDGCVEVEAAYYGAPRAGSGSASMCSGTTCTCGSSTRRPASCSVSTCVPRGATTASMIAIARRGRHPRHSPCSAERRPPASPSAPSVVPSTLKAPRIASDRCSACSRSRKSTASPSSRTPPRRHSSSGCRRIAFSGSTSTAGRRYT
jgi:transposase